MGNAKISTRKILEDPLLKDREKFGATLAGHSCWMFLDAEDSVSLHHKSKLCYATLWMYGKPIKRLFVGYELGYINNMYKFQSTKEDQVAWMDYVINRSFVSDAFLTKNVEEGFKYGFEMNLKLKSWWVDAAMTMARHVFELTWDFTYYLSLGYSEEEASVLCFNLEVKDLESFCYRTTHQNHVLARSGRTFGTYLGENILEEDLPNSWYNRGEGREKYYGIQSGLGGSNSSKFRTWFDKSLHSGEYKTVQVDVGFNSKETFMIFNKENIKSAMNAIKGEV